MSFIIYVVLIMFFVSEYVVIFIVDDVIEMIALNASWFALLLPGMSMCSGIHMNGILFFPSKNVFSWISFVISDGFCVLGMAIKLLSESLSIIHFVLVFAYSV